MAEKPILFSGPMVRAILDGRKTQTRRVVKHELTTFRLDGWEMNPETDLWHPYRNYVSGKCAGIGGRGIKCPYGKPGDVLWVRETWAEVGTCDPGLIVYRASYPECVPAGYENVPADIRDAGYRWKPSIHMPKSACRLRLTIKDIRVERLQEITGQDALNEGVQVPFCGCDVCATTGAMCPADQSACILEFQSLWDSINGNKKDKDGNDLHHAWDDNPWVWVVEFAAQETDR